MIYAAYALFLLGIACAAWALMLQPSMSLPGKVLIPLPPMPLSSLRLSSGLDRAAGRLLGLFGMLLPASARREDALVYTGVRFTEQQVRGITVLSALGCAFVFFTIAREVGSVEPLFILLAGVCGFILPTLWLTARVARRKRAIVRLLPEIIDLLSLCIGAGMDFLGSLNKVVLLKSFKQEPLIEELSIVLQEIRLGKRRFEALKALARRVNVPEASSFVRTLVQADRMGTPIAEVLGVHSEDIRFERFMRAERAALKAPIKILIPLILCIMPCVALIVGAPIFLQFMRQNPFGK